MNLGTTFKEIAGSAFWNKVETSLPEPLKGPFAEVRAHARRTRNVLFKPFGENSFLHQDAQKYPAYAEAKRNLAREKFKAAVFSFFKKPDDRKLKAEQLNEAFIKNADAPELLSGLIHIDRKDLPNLSPDVKSALKTKFETYLKDKELEKNELPQEKRHGPEHEDIYDQLYWADYILWQLRENTGQQTAPTTDEEQHLQKLTEYLPVAGQGSLYGRLHSERMKIEKPEGVTWKVDPNVTSKSFVQKIKGSFAKMPQPYQNIFQEFGLTILCAQVLLKKNENGEESPKEGAVGDYLSEDKTLSMPFYYYNRDSQCLLRNTELEATLFHELGHRLDHILDGASTDDPQFRKAYERDVENIKKSLDQDFVTYYLSKKDYPFARQTLKLEARSEAFAEIFAMEMLERSGFSTLGRKDIRRYFPETTKYVKNIMGRLENEYRLFPKSGHDAILNQALPAIPQSRLPAQPAMH